MPSRPRIHNPFPKLVRHHQDVRHTRLERERQQQRLSPTARGYDHEWRKVSEGFRKEHPLCAGPDSYCERRRKATPSKDVDHIVPHRGNMRLFWDQNNWQALCHTCHARKTAAEDGGFGNTPTIRRAQPVEPTHQRTPEPKRKPEPQPATRTPTREPSKRPETNPPYTKRTATGMRAQDMTPEQLSAQAGRQQQLSPVVRGCLPQ